MSPGPPCLATCLLASVETSQGLVGRWSPGIGDPTFVGWLTTAAYLVGAVLCWRAGQHPASGNLATRAWRVLAAALLALGINKQFDLQTMFAELGRQLALQQGWYERRRPVQLVFVLLIMALAGALVLWVVRLARGPLAPLRLALVGAVLLLGFIAVRASSLHAVDWLLGRSLVGLRLGALLELAGIACVTICAVRVGNLPKGEGR